MRSDGKTFGSPLNWMTHRQPPSAASLFTSEGYLHIAARVFVLRFGWIRVTCRRRSSGNADVDIESETRTIVQKGTERQICLCECVFPSCLAV